MITSVLENRARLAKSGPRCYLLLVCRGDDDCEIVEEAEPKLQDFGAAGGGLLALTDHPALAKV